MADRGDQQHGLWCRSAPELMVLMMAQTLPRVNTWPESNQHFVHGGYLPADRSRRAVDEYVIVMFFCWWRGTCPPAIFSSEHLPMATSKVPNRWMRVG